MTVNAIAKTLIWRRPKDDGQDFGHEEYIYLADGIGGLYSIDSKALLWWPHDPFTWTSYGSIKEAQAAAEQDWQGRCAALYAHPPAASSAARVAELEAALRTFCAAWKPEPGKMAASFTVAYDMAQRALSTPPARTPGASLPRRLMNLRRSSAPV